MPCKIRGCKSTDFYTSTPNICKRHKRESSVNKYKNTMQTNDLLLAENKKLKKRIKALKKQFASLSP